MSNEKICETQVRRKGKGSCARSNHAGLGRTLRELWKEELNGKIQLIDDISRGSFLEKKWKEEELGNKKELIRKKTVL